MFNMSKEEEVKFDIENLKQDFAIENMNVTDSDIEILKRYSNDEISQSEMINNIIQKTLWKEFKFKWKIYIVHEIQFIAILVLAH